MNSLFILKRTWLAVLFTMVLLTSALWAQLPQGFEGGTTMPTGWTTYDGDNDGQTFVVYASATAHGGTNVCRVHWNSVGNNDWLVTPALQITNDYKVVKFWAKSENSTYLEEFNVKLSTTTNAVASFTVNLQSVGNSPFTWTEYTYDLTPYIGQTVYLAVNCVSVDEFYLNLDDFDWAIQSSITGTVTSGGNPLADAKVAINTIPIFAMTNASGVYTLSGSFAGTFNLTASKNGYVNGTATGVVVGANQTVTQDFSLTALPMVTVSGQVNAGDTNAPLAGASVSLSGYANVGPVTTNAQGLFTLPGVFASNTYNINVTADGYLAYTAELVVGAVNQTVPTITIQESTNPPRNVVAVATEANCALTWRKPSSLPEVEYRYDDGTAVGQLGVQTGTTNTILGAAHRHNAEVTAVSWMLTDNGGPHAAVDVWVFGLTNGVPDNTNVLYHATNVASTDLTWMTHTLPEAINCPNGFFVGVSYTGFLALGLDDGLGADYPFTNNTQYASNNYTTTEFAALETLGAFSGSFTIRAMGYDHGALPASIARINMNSMDSKRNSHYANLTKSECAPIFTNFSMLPTTLNRALQGYKISRSTLANIANPNAWENIGTTATANDTTYTDATWAQQPLGLYKYIIQARYSNNVLSAEALSNMVARDMNAQVIVNLSTVNGISPVGAIVKLTCTDADPNHVYQMTATSATVVFPTVWKAIYQVKVTLPGYNTFIEENVDINTNPFGYDVLLQVSNTIFLKVLKARYSLQLVGQ